MTYRDNETRLSLRHPPDPFACFESVARSWKWFKDREPDRAGMVIGSKPLRGPRGAWTAFTHPPRGLYNATWDEGSPRQLSLSIDFGWGHSIVATRKGSRPTVPESLELLAPTVFWTGVGTHIYDEWTWDAAKRDAVFIPDSGFGFGHGGHGWAAFFKGDGHRQVVSRRWLQYGPWRHVHVPEHDLTMVQFHDLAADAVTAREQAVPGQQMMGYSQIGGLFFHLEPNAHPHGPIDGLYDRRTRTFRVMMHGKALTPKLVQDLGWWRAANRDYSGPHKLPIERIALVFLEEDAARLALNIAWKSEFEVWAIIGDREQRLDEGYEPDYQPPEWVQRARDRDGF